MLKKDKNAIFNLLKDSRIGLENFIVSEKEIAGYDGIVIVYRNTPLEFRVLQSTVSYESFKYQHSTFSPNFAMSGLVPVAGFLSIGEICIQISRWLQAHINPYIDEQTEPDLLEELINGNHSLNVDKLDFNDQTDFSGDEKTQVMLAINDLKFLIQKELNTTDEEQKVVVERLDYLAEAANRHNKFDWKSLAVSTLISISIAISLDTERGNQLFKLFKQVFSIIPQLGHGQ